MHAQNQSIVTCLVHLLNYCNSRITHYGVPVSHKWVCTRKEFVEDAYYLYIKIKINISNSYSIHCN
jgi:hypothetical protein